MTSILTEVTTEVEQEVDQAELQPYIHPKTQKCYNEGNITLVSCDQFTFKVHDYVLKAASPVFLDILCADDARNEPIPLSETASEIHRYLHLIVDHWVDPSDEPDETVDHTTEDERGWTPLDLRRREDIKKFECLVDVCNKYQTVNHDKILQNHALKLASEWGSSIAYTIFKVANEKLWDDVASTAIAHFDSTGWRGELGKSDGLEWEAGVQGYPWAIPPRHIKNQMSFDQFINFVKACAYSIEKKEEKLKVNWKKVGKAFKSSGKKDTEDEK